MSEAGACDVCERVIPPHAHYVVRIDVFADPAMPPITEEEIEAMDLDRTMKELLKQMEGMTAEELQDQVHRRFEYKICRACQIRFLTNPLGKSRGPQHMAGQRN
jgi:hypothetical protein